VNIELSTIVIDCANPAGLGRFWCAATGYVTLHEDDEPLDPDDTWVKIGPKDGGTAMAFQRVPEPKTVKNRVHLDVNAGGGRDTPQDERRRRVGAEVERLVAAGASIVREMNERGEHWVVMQDPESNEFCVQ